MKIAINKCYGGFSLSPLAVKRLAELNGKECYFFVPAPEEPFSMVPFSMVPVPIEGIPERTLFWSAYSVPNPDEVCPSQDNWHELSTEERRASNAAWKAVSLDQRPEDRSDPKLIQVIEELGTVAASGSCASLAIVEIPDGVEYTIEEYDGNEHIAEKHRTWA